MAKRSKIKKAPADSIFSSESFSGKGNLWIALLLAVVSFLVYWPSLQSDFVYDARQEILDEGFVISPENLSNVLSLKTVEMDVMLRDRPGQILYMMLINAMGGKKPFGYHLGSNLLQAANAAILFILLCRLIASELANSDARAIWRTQLAAAAATLIFAVHPVAVESVAEVSYCATLLVTFFTLSALLMATAFRPENFRVAILTGGIGVLCAFAAVICKESGAAVASLLAVYWFLFRRQEPKKPWLIFLGGAIAVTAAFLAALFFLSPPNRDHLGFLGGSCSQVFLIQPRLWVFMMGKLLWPMQLSAHYTLPSLEGLSSSFAWLVLLVVIALQVWLAIKSRVGALGVAIYWLGLATVSNFVPLYHPVADRFYHLPLAGVAMQLLAVVAMTLKQRLGFWMAMAPVLAVILPLGYLTQVRENVFASDTLLWSDTLRVNPFSSMARNNLGLTLMRKGELDGAASEFRQALKMAPKYLDARNNLGLVLVQKGQAEEGMTQYRQALEIDPAFVQARNNLGLALYQAGRVDEATLNFEKILETHPGIAEVHNNLGLALVQKGKKEEALAEFQKAMALKPGYSEAQDNAIRTKEELDQRAAPGAR